MRIRIWLALALAVAANLAGLVPGRLAAQERDFSGVEVKAAKVAGNVYMLQGAGGNIGASVGADGLLIVDDQYAPLVDKIRAALKGVNPGKLRFVLNTHWHGDHTGGNAALSKEAEILAHTNVRKRLSTEQLLFGEKIPPSPKEALPVITFDESVSIHFNGEEIKVLHFPHGHTDGDSVVFFTGSNVVHLGDDFVSMLFPFVDIHNGGSVQGLAENVGKVIGMVPADVKIIPGHGPLSTLEDLRTYHGMLVESMELVRSRIAAGKTREQVKAEGMPAKWASWAHTFVTTEFWLETVYDSLQGSGGGAPGAHQHHHHH